MNIRDVMFEQYLALASDPGTSQQRFVMVKGAQHEALSAAALLPETPLSEHYQEAVGTFIRAKQSSYRSAARSLAHFANSKASGARMRGALLAPLDHPKPTGPATEAVERMDAEIAADRLRRKL